MIDFFFFFFFFGETQEHKALRKEFSSAFKRANSLIAVLGLPNVSYKKLWGISFHSYTGTSPHRRAKQLGVSHSALYRAMDDSELDGHVARINSVIHVLLLDSFPDTLSLYEAVRAASAPQPP